MTALRKAITLLNEMLETFQISGAPKHMIDIYENAIEFLEISDVNLRLKSDNAKTND